MTPIHAVHRLFQYRKAISSKPFSARGKSVKRCQHCLLAEQFCTCDYRQLLHSDVSFMLIMYDDEVLKPSNSGRLIADLVPDVHAYIWSRTHINRKILALINDSNYFPILIFPAKYAASAQPIIDHQTIPARIGQRRPLFIMLDGSWREAIKMFRKSKFLHHLPILTFTPDFAANYKLRKGQRDFQLGTAEVAALALAVAGERDNAQSLTAWFDLFVESSLLSKSRQSTHDQSHRQHLIDSFLLSVRE